MNKNSLMYLVFIAFFMALLGCGEKPDFHSTPITIDDNSKISSSIVEGIDKTIDLCSRISDDDYNYYFCIKCQSEDVILDNTDRDGVKNLSENLITPPTNTENFTELTFEDILSGIYYGIESNYVFFKSEQRKKAFMNKVRSLDVILANANKGSALNKIENDIKEKSIYWVYGGEDYSRAKLNELLDLIVFKIKYPEVIIQNSMDFSSNAYWNPATTQSGWVKIALLVMGVYAIAKLATWPVVAPSEIAVHCTDCDYCYFSCDIKYADIETRGMYDAYMECRNSCQNSTDCQECFK